jgi:uncharacterized membrane protein YbjE (DUF340 family)
MIRYILAVLLFGAVAGYANNAWGNVAADSWLSYLFDAALLLLLFLMGLSFGSDKTAMGKLRKVGVKILVLPFCIALGSIIGGLIGGLLLGVNVFGSMAVCAGFGWYTLAGPLAGQLLGTEFGALGFAVNFLRELLTIATVLLTAKAGKYVTVAFGGATTMDTTLPIIVRYCGSEALIAAFSSGFVLSMMAPFVITAIASFR